ncbi:metallo-beta-lactamase [Streptomyces eurocidicus]|uniref:Glyoxylase-like metal-dependent hydrolase (Beta-lactamase superfamily II) n=1 Tax=Streptomyces eurocidicus TaxID=66423 RepID=A0A2N8P2Q4_STREU|nr:MBL fold metallo-hydrolase [Streptomyces eurocidicus]MBB5117441.1 glyoxylase-like metal-dependent hydrolase (beta-lactamase superfamily II) [Streptomyces eurocidicus]MBF6053284.1 MBL fold metallo-hydrolase [Streptomyces eurocidicus]PNE35293.1 metallo-beta-lactamase [Streptomyces eurocidicus]
MESDEATARWERLAPGVARRRMPGWDATIGVIAGASGVLLVDTGATVREGAEVRRDVREIFGRAVTHIALTHAHFDHVFGTAAFSGVEVYGAAGLAELLERGREELRRDAVRHGVAPEAAANAAELLVRPRHRVSGELTLDLGGGRRVLLADIGPGHTAHDLAVFVAGEGGAPEVVFCGDLVEESGEPQAGPDAVPRRWPDALDRLLALGGEDAVYVPGHGAVVDARFVRAQRDALAERFGVS